MKTQEATLKDMRRSLRPGTPAFLFQYVGAEHNRWCSEDSPMGEVCQKALLEGQAPVLDHAGRPLKGLRGQDIIIHNIEKVTA